MCASWNDVSRNLLKNDINVYKNIKGETKNFCDSDYLLHDNIGIDNNKLIHAALDAQKIIEEKTEITKVNKINCLMRDFSLSKSVKAKGHIMDNQLPR